MAFLILPELIAQYGGTKQALAKAIHISPSAFSRLTTIPPSVDVCLRLARVTGANPSRVLRSAGREDMADQLEALYGHAAQRRVGRRLTPKDERTIAAIKAMPKSTQRALHVLIELLTAPTSITKPAAAVARRRRRTKKAA